jgi:hypothetical protein
MGSHVIALRDYSKEQTLINYPLGPLTAGNLAAVQTKIGTLAGDQSALVLGSVEYGQTHLDKVLVNGDAAATDPFAQRELKWLVVYQDVTTKRLHHLEIGTANLTTGHLLGNTDEANIANADWAAYKTSFEDAVKAPDTNNAVTLLSAHVVGRNT